MVNCYNCIHCKILNPKNICTDIEHCKCIKWHWDKIVMLETVRKNTIAIQRFSKDCKDYEDARE